MQTRVTIIILLLCGTMAWAGKPNFIFMLSDDQDWTGLSVQMHPDHKGSRSAFIQTPNIERLASEGMRFSAAYAPSPVCSPTRISLQTGMSPAQLHWTKASPTFGASAGYKLVSPVLRKSIREEEVTIAELLKTAGYATAHYGKWHLSGGGPARHGYDESDGDTGNGDAAPHKGDNPVDIVGMSTRAAAFMKKNAAKDTPFFIQLSYHALHYPENANPETVEKYRKILAGGDERRVGRAAISENLDSGVGMIMKAVEDLGIADNTYLIYMSDNGGGGGGGGRGDRGGRGQGAGERPLQGGKGSVWEGGIRVPLIVRGPEIAADSWCHQRVVGFDILPTLCDLGGVENALPEGVEGGSFAHLLEGSTEPVKRWKEELVFHFPHYQGDTPHTSMFLGDHKIIKFYETGDVKLFDIGKDIGERNDLAEMMPDKAAGMEKTLMAHLEEIGAQLPKPNPDAVEGRVYSGKGGGGGRRGRDGARGGGRRPDGAPGGGRPRRNREGGQQPPSR